MTKDTFKSKEKMKNKEIYVIRIENHPKPRVFYYSFYRVNKRVVYFSSIEEAKKVRFGVILKVGESLKDVSAIGGWGFIDGKWGYEEVK